MSGEGRARKNIRTAMAGMGVGEEEMDEGEGEEVNQDNVEAEKGGLGGGLLALKATGLLTQDDETGSTTLTDACNGFNKLIRLVMFWTVRHRWPVGARFVFNCYSHWVQLLLHQPGDAPVILLIQEGVT